MVGVSNDEGEVYYQIDYDDCDQEELDAGQLWDSVIYHPRMDEAKDTMPHIPEVGHFVLFALEQKPRIGKVMSIDVDAQKPISIHLWKPNKDCKSLDQARFRPSMSESGPDLMIIHSSQVRLTALSLTDEGYFSKASRGQVKRLLYPKVSSAKPMHTHVKTVPKRGKSKGVSVPKASTKRSTRPRTQSRYQLRSRD